jgi:hypothetical protein
MQRIHTWAGIGIIKEQTMRFRPRARAIRNGVVAGVLITALGAAGDAIAAAVHSDLSYAGPLWSVIAAVSGVLMLGAGYITTHLAGTVTMGGLTGALAGLFGGIGFSATWALFGPLATGAEWDALLVNAGVGILYGLLLIVPLATISGAFLGLLGARVGIARRPMMPTV